MTDEQNIPSATSEEPAVSTEAAATIEAPEVATDAPLSESQVALNAIADATDSTEAAPSDVAPSAPTGVHSLLRSGLDTLGKLEHFTVEELEFLAKWLEGVL